MKTLTILAAVLLISACGKPTEPATETTSDAAQDAATEAADAAQQQAAAANTEKLQEILAAMPEEVQARFEYRNPQQTLEFFGIMPGMTVVEALPGGGWYSKILIPYLGGDGTLIGVDYSVDMLKLFGTMSEERLAAKETWVEDWTEQASGWRGEDGASVEAFVFGSMPEDFTGRADAVLMIRALHNLNRFEEEGGFRSAALRDSFRILKPGGLLGIVQHEAPASLSDEWADGSNGYLKKDSVIAAVEAEGFEFVSASDINSNPADQPTEADFVWRLPPTLGTSRSDEALKEQMMNIGESNRMTLKFRKPD